MRLLKLLGWIWGSVQEREKKSGYPQKEKNPSILFFLSAKAAYKTLRHEHTGMNAGNNIKGSAKIPLQEVKIRDYWRWRKYSGIFTFCNFIFRWSHTATLGRQDCGREVVWWKSARLLLQLWPTSRWLTSCGLRWQCALLSSRHMMTPLHAGKWKRKKIMCVS